MARLPRAAPFALFPELRKADELRVTRRLEDARGRFIDARIAEWTAGEAPSTSSDLEKALGPGEFYVTPHYHGVQSGRPLRTTHLDSKGEVPRRAGEESEKKDGLTVKDFLQVLEAQAKSTREVLADANRVVSATLREVATAAREDARANQEWMATVLDKMESRATRTSDFQRFLEGERVSDRARLAELEKELRTKSESLIRRASIEDRMADAIIPRAGMFIDRIGGMMPPQLSAPTNGAPAMPSSAATTAENIPVGVDGVPERIPTATELERFFSAGGMLSDSDAATWFKLYQSGRLNADQVRVLSGQLQGLMSSASGAA